MVHRLPFYEQTQKSSDTDNFRLHFSELNAILAIPAFPHSYINLDYPQQNASVRCKLLYLWVLYFPFQNYFIFAFKDFSIINPILDPTPPFLAISKHFNYRI